jgi:hypothetical protein
MGRKKSSYRPKGVRTDVMGWVKAGMNPARNLPIVLTIRIKNHDSVESLRNGQATRQTLDPLIGAFNMAEALVTLGFGTEYAEVVRDGQLALLVMARRGLRTGGKFLCSGPELTAINLALEVHDAQLDVVTVQDMEKALNIVETAIRLKKVNKISATEEESKVGLVFA